MTKPSEHEAAHSLSEAADQARKRREWQMNNRPKLPAPEPVVTPLLVVVAVLGALFVSGIGWLGCIMAGVCK